MFRTRRMCHLRDNSYFSIRNRMRSRLHSFDTNFRAFLSRPLCVTSTYGVHIWTFPWLRRRHLFGSRRSASEERRLERVCRSTHRCSFSHERRGNGRARAAPLGADAASGGWGWRKRALAGLAILGTVAACVCAVAATGATLLASKIAPPLDLRLYLRSARFDRAGPRAARVAPSGNPGPSRPNFAKTRVTPRHRVQTSVATDFSSTPAQLSGDVRAAFVDPTRPRLPL